MDAARKRDPQSAEAYKAEGELAHILLHRGRRDAEVTKMAETAAEGRERTLGPDHPHTLTNLAFVYQASGKLLAAIERFERVRDAKTVKLGLEHLDALTTLGSLASAFQASGRPQEATALFERVRDAQIAKLGPEHPDTLKTLNHLAAAYWSMNQLHKSVPLFKVVLKRQEAKLSRRYPNTLLAVANLGINNKDSGRLDEAIPLIEETYHASGKFPNIRWVGAQLLETYAKAVRSTEAAKLVSELLADARKTSPKESTQLAGALASFSLTLLQLKAYADAEPLLCECLAIREKTQPDLWSTFNSKSQLGGALLGLKQYAEAEPLLIVRYQGMHQREANIRPHAKARLPEALERLIQLYEATDNPDEAARWRKELDTRKAAEKLPEKKP